MPPARSLRAAGWAFRSVHIGFVFVRADVRVKEWRAYEGRERTQKEDQWKTPCPQFRAPASVLPSERGAFERPARKRRNQVNIEVENVFAMWWRT